MPLTAMERKHLLEHGAQRRVAAKARVAESYVSGIVNETLTPRTARGRKTVRRVQVILARELGMPVDEAFPPRITAPAEIAPDARTRAA